MTLLELKKVRTEYVDAARALYERAETESRELTEEETEQFDRSMAEADTLTDRIARMEKLEGFETEQRNSRRVTRSEPTETRGSDVLRAWLTAGSDVQLSAEQKRTLAETGLDSKAIRIRLASEPLKSTRYDEFRAWQNRAQSVGTASAGGYLVAQDFSSEIEKAMLAFGGMREAARVIRTSTGADLPWPLSDDTANAAAIVGENVAITETDMVFASKTLKAYKYSSNIIKVSVELLQDSAINVAEVVGSALGERIARGTNAHFTTGTGSGQPEGAVTGSFQGLIGASATAVTADELLDLIHSVDPSYRKNAKFMLNDSTLKAIKKLKDSTGRPLFMKSLAEGEPDTINGYQYIINQSVASMAAGAKSILFGDFSKVIIRDVLDISLARLDERYAEFGQVAFVALSRHDSRVLDAGQHPVKHFRNL